MDRTLVTPAAFRIWFRSSLLLAVAGAGVSLTGCQVDVGGQTLPSGYYLQDDIQYFPAGPEFKLSKEAAALYRAMRSVLRAALVEGGTTLENGNFRRADGTAGEFAGQLMVYGRHGQPCSACGQPVERITVAQRGTFLCPCCQPPGE